FVWRGRRLGAMPRLPIRVELGIARLGERRVRLTPFGLRRRAIDRGANKGMAERDALPDLQEPGVLCSIGSLDRQAEVRRGAHQQERVAEWLRRRHDKQPSRVLRKRLQSAPEAVFDPPGK